MSILQATGVIQPIGGKGMKVIQCEENRIHEMLEDNGVRERVIEGMQCLQILQLTCQAFTTMSFTSMVQRHEPVSYTHLPSFHDFSGSSALHISSSITFPSPEHSGHIPLGSLKEKQEALPI